LKFLDGKNLRADSDNDKDFEAQYKEVKKLRKIPIEELKKALKEA